MRQPKCLKVWAQQCQWLSQVPLHTINCLKDITSKAAIIRANKEFFEKNMNVSNLSLQEHILRELDLGV